MRKSVADMHALGRQQSEPRPSRRQIILSCVALLACITIWPAWFAQAADDDAGSIEYRVKAAFLQKFAGYVEWPEKSFSKPDTPITIAVTGAEPLAAELAQAVSGRTINGRPVEIRRLNSGESLAGVHILFVGKTESARLPQMLQATQPRPILTVTESDGALTQGSIINFLIVERHIRFEVALDTAEKNGLKLSSRLLAVAQDVRSGSR